MNKKLAKKLLTYISGGLFLLAFLLNWLNTPKQAVDFLYILSMIAGGYFVVLGAVRGLVKQRFLNIDFLVTIAAIGALYINQLSEAAAVIFFFSLAEFFEEFGIERSRRAVEALIKKSPRTATLKNGETVPIEQVKINDLFIVRPGDLVPLDGKVSTGNSSVDEATITGEPVPKEKHSGDEVFAGTLNQNGYLEVITIKESKDSTFAKIVSLVEKAQRSKAPAQEFIDVFAKYYTPTVVGLAFLMATIPPLFFGGVFMDWLYRALVLLVIACPCSLVISTPVAIASAIGGASKRGILIKGGKYLEALSKIKAVAFDKTRTLTLGEPVVSEVITFNGFAEEMVIADAAGIEKFSSHPLSKSIMDFAESKGIAAHDMRSYQNFAGKGGKANCLVCEDKDHCIGNLKFIGAESHATKEVLEKTEHLERQGKTAVLVSEGKNVMGALAIADEIRPESKDTISQLKKNKIKSVIVTGDNEHTAGYVARQLGIEEVHASLLPDEKVKQIEQLKQHYQHVAMVGDGVNDAPSLATATVGIAMGAGGSDVAIETADVALMNNNLLNIPYAIRLGKKAIVTMKQNIGVSLGIKALFMILALLGHADLQWAIGADSIMAILVILNSLRLFSIN